MVETALTMVLVQGLASQRGWGTSFSTTSGAVISEVRNVMVANFLKSDADLLLMIDADQSIGRDGLQRIIDLGQPVVGCIYPKRKYEWATVDLGVTTNIDEVVYQASDFVGKIDFGPEGSTQLMNGFAKAVRVGTGILLLRRVVFETLMARFPELKNRGFHSDEYPGLEEHNWGFFNHIEREGRSSMPEDFSFCRRWRESGGEIWADVTDNSTHIGRHPFTGNYLDYLKAKSLIDQA